MSPLILSLPVMYAVVGLASPLTIFIIVSSLAEIVQSASFSPSATETAPSATVTVQVPTSAMSNAKLLFMPAVLAGSTLEGRASKNSCTVIWSPWVSVEHGVGGQRVGRGRGRRNRR